MVKEGFRDARRKYVIVRREDFEMIKRELEQFRPALEGNLWLTASSVR